MPSSDLFVTFLMNVTNLITQQIVETSLFQSHYIAKSFTLTLGKEDK